MVKFHSRLKEKPGEFEEKDKEGVDLYQKAICLAAHAEV